MKPTLNVVVVLYERYKIWPLHCSEYTHAGALLSCYCKKKTGFINEVIADKYSTVWIRFKLLKGSDQ
jgi:hypothetical protein